ncbi:hypothetical protein [Coleofasciculus sp. G2-EDA-02]|uniref:hypothetical protein n=1 Tax=Coleofasciculus sp. G2-EDA-02 TaxID=3069529 RepID=UPI00330559A1
MKPAPTQTRAGTLSLHSVAQILFGLSDRHFIGAVGWTSPETGDLYGFGSF